MKTKKDRLIAQQAATIASLRRDLEIMAEAMFSEKHNPRKGLETR